MQAEDTVSELCTKARDMQNSFGKTGFTLSWSITESRQTVTLPNLPMHNKVSEWYVRTQRNG